MQPVKNDGIMESGKEDSMKPCRHDLYIVSKHPETGETFYVCRKCGALIDQDGEVVQKSSDEIPY